MTTGKISKRSVSAVKPGSRDKYLWDSKLKGFGIKCTPTGSRIYIVQYRSGGRSSPTRRVTIGKHGSPWTPDMARDKAERVLAEVKLGGDPAQERTKRRQEPTISVLANRYLVEHVSAHNKPATAKEMRRLVETRIVPKLGRVRTSELARAQVKSWHSAMHATPTEANRALGTLSRMMSLASGDWELRRDNPCLGISKFPERKRERFFSEDELKRIGEILNAAEKVNSILPGVINAIRLLAVTGCRLGEIRTLRWQDVDFEGHALRLADAKVGPRTVPLGAPALSLLAGIERDGEYVVFGRDPDKPLPQGTIEGAWDRIRAKAGVDDGRLHDFRHTTGTYAAQAGFNAFQVRDLLGHKTLAMTGRYVERATDPLRDVADAVAGRIAAAMEGKTAEVVELPRKA